MVDGGREGQSGRVWEGTSIPDTGFWLEDYCSFVSYLNDQSVKFSLLPPFLSNPNVSVKEDKHFLIFFPGFIVPIALSISQEDFKVLLPFHFR